MQSRGAGSHLLQLESQESLYSLILLLVLLHSIKFIYYLCSSQFCTHIAGTMQRRVGSGFLSQILFWLSAVTPKTKKKKRSLGIRQSSIPILTKIPQKFWACIIKTIILGKDSLMFLIGLGRHMQKSSCCLLTRMHAGGYQCCSQQSLRSPVLA